MFKKTTSIVILIVLSMVLIACDDKPKEATTTQATKNSQEVVKTANNKNSEYIEAINKALLENGKMGCINNGIMSVYGKKLIYVNFNEDEDAFEKVGFSKRIKESNLGGYEYELTEKGKEFFNEKEFCFKAANIKVNEILTTNQSVNDFGEQMIKILFNYLTENKAGWIKDEILADDIHIQNIFINEKQKSIYTTLIFKDNAWQVQFNDFIPSKKF